ncbi:MAG: hypothetical protein AB7D07_07780 [Desulfovibrionaceae bacterium]
MTTTVYVIQFRNNQPVWGIFDDGRLELCEPPATKKRSIVVAILPDRYFFYYRPQSVAAASFRKARAAVQLQMSHLFPSFDEQQSIGMLKPHNGNLLGFFTRPELADFIAEHHKLLSSATVITTEFAICWRDAAVEEVDAFIWRGEDKLKALCSGDNLLFFQADESELETRIAHLEVKPAETLDWAASLSRHISGGNKWSSLRTPVRLPVDEQTSLQPYRRAMLLIFLVGALAVAGQYIRLQHHQGRVEQWRDRTQSLYSSIFGPAPGPDPYGKLLYTMNQLQRTQSKGVNVLDILTALSKQPPAGLDVENLNFSVESGSIMGRTDSYDGLESYLNALNSDSTYAFTLEQAANTKDGIQFHLRVTITQ